MATPGALGFLVAFCEQRASVSGSAENLACWASERSSRVGNVGSYGAPFVSLSFAACLSFAALLDSFWCEKSRLS